MKAIKANRFGVENRHGVFKFVQLCLKVQLISSNFDTREDYELFLESFLNSIENEKDPRNLMTIFNMIHLMSKLRLNDYVEEFFESVFCYFPITFRSSPTDPNLITVEELKLSLRRVIAGDKRFGDLAVSLLIDKLSSNSASAKIDSMDVLIDAVSFYDPKSFVQFKYQLEIALFSEITGNPEPKIQNKALQLVRLLSNRFLPENDTINWMNKFLKEAILAIELDSREIMSKSAVLIEAVASSCEESFKYALEKCLNSLLKIAHEGWSIRGQAARNCLVALLSPLKINPKWIENIKENSDVLETFLTSIKSDCESYGVYLVIFSFVCPILSFNCKNEFIKELIKTCAHQNIPSELKNCIWLASKSYPVGFIDYINDLENDQILSALSSTPELSKASLKRLIDLKRISAVEEIIPKADLSVVAQDDELIYELLSLSLSPFSIVKIVSKCSYIIQTAIINLNIKFSEAVISVRPEVIENCDIVILERITSLNCDAIASLFNKCPKLWSPRINEIYFKENPKFFISALRGLIYRLDPLGSEILKLNLENSQFPVNLYAQMFKKTNDSELFTSNETFHTKRSLHLQWLLSSFLPPPDANSINSLALLISIFSCASASLVSLHAKIIPNLVLQFLTLCDESAELEVDVSVKSEAWKVLVNLLEKSEVQSIDELISLALKHSSVSKEPASILRFWAMRLLSKLVEIPFTRDLCKESAFNYQENIIITLKTDSLIDPKRAVRQEAARAVNLWFVLHEGVL